MLDLCELEERAALMEFDGGLSRFDAETKSAEAQGYTRWQAMQEVRRENSRGDTQRAGHNGTTDERDSSHNVPGVQPTSTQQDRAVPERNVHTGSGSLVLSSLPVERGAQL